MMLVYHVTFCHFCSCSILVYGSVDTAAQCLLTLHNPEGCPVLCLKHSPRYLFAGLRNGTVRVYERSSSGKMPLCFRPLVSLQPLGIFLKSKLCQLPTFSNHQFVYFYCFCVIFCYTQQYSATEALHSHAFIHFISCDYKLISSVFLRSCVIFVFVVVLLLPAIVVSECRRAIFDSSLGREGSASLALTYVERYQNETGKSVL